MFNVSKTGGRRMLGRGITLKALELFEALATRGTLAAAAEAVGISLPAASQQLSNLETSLGAQLIDRRHRPLRLTPAGRLLLRRAEAALHQIRGAQTDLATFDLGQLPHLRLGMIDDLDAEITPRLVIRLAGSLTGCDFRLSTLPSHEILRRLAEGGLDIGVSAVPRKPPEGLMAWPLLRDPFVLAMPRGLDLPPDPDLTALRPLAFLRYDRDQFFGRQIEEQLARLRIDLPHRFELDSNQSILGLVASGAGWSITTPLAWLRAPHWAAQVALHPLPVPAFARTIALYADGQRSGGLARDIARTLRTLLAETAIPRAQSAAPWLGGAFRVLED